MATSSAVTVFQSSGIPEYNSNVGWKIWSEQLEIHFTELKCEDDSIKRAILLKSLGAETYSTLHSLCDPISPAKKTFKELCQILESHFTPPTIIFSERKKFHTSIREEGESVSEWYARIKKLALNCKFAEHLNIMILDHFIIGLPAPIFERLCEEDESLTLEQARKKAMIMETKLCNKTTREEINVNYVHQSERQSKIYNGQNAVGMSRRRSSSNSGNSHHNVGRSKTACAHCGWRNHEAANCKFKESICFSCRKIGHLASVCKQHNKRYVNFVSDSDSDVTINNIFEHSIFSVKDSSSSGVYSLPVSIDGVKLNAVCDTGAPCNLVSAQFYDENKFKTPLRECKTPYVNYSGERIGLIGEYDARITYEGTSKVLRVVVTNTNNKPLLGRSFLRAFNFDLMQVCAIRTENFASVTDQIKVEFSEVFENRLGAYNICEISLDIVSDAKPIFFKPRPVAFAWREKVESKLRKMIDDGIIEQIDNSEWGTPLVPILKPNGDLRICGDYKVTLNKYLVDFKYPLPRIEEIFASLQGGELFTKLDLSNAYNQLVLDEKSQRLCAWSTHIGTFKIKRLPFGIKTAAAIFQKTMENLLRDISNVVVYQDDITVTGKNFQEHICTLRKVLVKLKSAGLKLNQEKCKFFQPKISYLGFSIDKNGLSKDETRISSVVNSPIPRNVSEVRAFLGMVNYYSKFITNFSQKMLPLYDLLKKENKYVWSKECQRAYDTIKSDVTSDQVLVHFNPNLPIILTTDASGSAVSGVLSHKLENNLKPIAFVSRALSKSERNYSTLEKEALAIIYCVTKLRQYLLGNQFILRTDHKPLTAIFGENKGLPIMASARMQRWALILSGFNYSVQYIKGDSNHADGLSRMPQCVHSKDSQEVNYINFIESKENISIDFKKVARETRRDPILSKLCEAVLQGTVHKLRQEDFSPYRTKDIELSVEYDCILWGYRVVIPSKLRTTILQQLHESHLGIVKTKSLARSYVWWPGLDKDIENMVKSCQSCQQLLCSPAKSPLIPWAPEDGVWSRIHVDFAGPINNFYFLIVIDSFSKFVEVFKTKEITTAFTISKIRELFSRYGLVDILVSDNGRQFTSDDFRKFLKMNNVQHVLTAPGHPATNGQAENIVKTLKKSIISNLKSNENCSIDTALNRFLADYRNTKHCTTGESPSKLFFGRSLKTRFSNLKPPLTKNKILEKQTKSILNYKGKRNEEFSKGQEVLIRDYRNPNKPSWSQATIKKQLGPRSYSCVLTYNNREIKRHLDQIRNRETTRSDETNEQEQECPNIQIHTDGLTSIGTERELRPRHEGRVIKISEID